TYTLTADKPSGALPIAERLRSLAQEQDDPTLMTQAYGALATTLYWLGDFESARQYAMRAAKIWRSGNVRSSHTERPPDGRRVFGLSGAIGVASRRDRLQPKDHG